MAKFCTSIQKSLGWCQGTPELPGVKRRIYFIAKSYIVTFRSFLVTNSDVQLPR